MQALTYRLLRFISGVNPWARRRLTVTGRFFFAGLLVTAAIGIDTELTLAYQIFTLIASVIFVAFVAQLFLRTRFHATRELPPFATIGEPVSYRIRVHNDDQTAHTSLALVDELIDPRPTYAEFRQTKGGDAPRASVLARWRALLSRRQVAETKPCPIGILGPGDDVDIKYELTPSHRGILEFDAVALAKSDPLGIFYALSRAPLKGSLLVLPKRYALPELELPGTRIYQHGGVTLAASKGDTEEFVGLRDYRAGDPLQKIHWKSFARVGRPVVKEYQDEFFERHALVLDTFSAVHEETVFEEAVAVAASFACTIETQENLLDLMFVGAEAYTFTAGIGQLHAVGMLEILAGVEACTDKPFRELHEAVLERLAVLSSCILILLRWDTPRRDIVDDLQARGLPLKVLVISDADIEIEPDAGSLHVLRTADIQQGLAAL